MTNEKLMINDKRKMLNALPSATAKIVANTPVKSKDGTRTFRD
jgi:hypothetical protein